MDKAEFIREYDLNAARKQKTEKQPASHQQAALDKLEKWYRKREANAGGILVLPTGAGKTFTATRFLCRLPMSEGYKVLWLAHTHHLLEQAFGAFEDSVGLIAEPRRKLTVRVVSGTPGHFPVHTIKTTDDVLVATLQTISRAQRKEQKQFLSFLDSADGKLFVIFDEAHHAPAYSYRNLLGFLRERCSNMHLLGLTATPTYTDEKKRGWLTRLFPQGIIHQETPQKLMAAGILSRPISEEPKTSLAPEFDEREYEKWLGTNRDLPEEIITQLADNKDRNAFIADYYAQHKKRYGKTIIFADRWWQCDFIREALRKRKIKADVVYSHVDADPGSAEARNKRGRDENARVLQEFRHGDLDVLINVRMLTEGTDVPDVQSVFLTRQTTSQILLTQMVGRALRGPKFGGTEEAYIVSFVDDWRRLINWAEYDQLAEGLADDTVPEYGKRPPLQLISIELVRMLARQMDSGISMTPGPFLSLLPVGWYRVEYQAAIEDTEDLETVRRLIMVFEKEKKGYENLITKLAGSRLAEFEAPDLSPEALAGKVKKLQSQFFPKAADEHFGSDLHRDILDVARHIAQNRARPRFFAFDERGRHNLDEVAQDFVAKDLGPSAIDDALRAEYNSTDRYWKTIYYRYDQFKSQCDACVNRLLHADRHGAEPETHVPVFSVPEQVPDREPGEDIKLQVRERDGYTCVCCSYESRRALQVDHIIPHYSGGSNLLDNLQTLCRTCNREKGTRNINFRDPETDLTQPHRSFPQLKPPPPRFAGDAYAWERFLRRSINFFYQCGAVHDVRIGARGKGFYNWTVELKAGNDPAWLKAHLKGLLQTIRRVKEKAGYGVPKSITITSPGKPDVTYSATKG